MSNHNLIVRTNAWIIEATNAGWLPCYVAADAANSLVRYWKDAKRDGYADDVLVNDIDEVIEQLKDLKKTLTATVLDQINDAVNGS